MLDTHLEQTRKELAEYEKGAKKLKNAPSGGLFKKGGASAYCGELCAHLEKRDKSCIVCDKLDYTMGRYYEVLLDMWATEPEFRKKFASAKGLCLPHFRTLLALAPKKLSQKDAAEFVFEMVQKQNAELARIQEDVHRFTLKFDYRNRDMEWGTAKDAPVRAIEKIAGYIRREDADE